MGSWPRGGRGDGARDPRDAGRDPSPRCSSSVSPLGNAPTSLMLHVGSAGLDRKQRAACARAGPAALGATAGRGAVRVRGPEVRASVRRGFCPSGPRGETLAALLVLGAMLVRREAACFPAPGARVRRPTRAPGASAPAPGAAAGEGLGEPGSDFSGRYWWPGSLRLGGLWIRL